MAMTALHDTTLSDVPEGTGPAPADPPARRGVAVPAETLDAVRDLYDRGLYLQAYRLGRAHGPPGEWLGAEARTLAGRLTMNLGAPRLSAVLHQRAFRARPADPHIAYFHARRRLDRGGPLDAWRFLTTGRYAGCTPAGLSADEWELGAFRGHLLAMLRDFDRADEWIAAAERVAAHTPWFWVEKGSVLEAQDRYAEALEAHREGLPADQIRRPVQRVDHQHPGQQRVPAHADQPLGAADEGAGVRIRLGGAVEHLGHARPAVVEALGRPGLSERPGAQPGRQPPAGKVGAVGVVAAFADQQRGVPAEHGPLVEGARLGVRVRRGGRRRVGLAHRTG